MKHSAWEERLDEIIARAALRLQERIQLAYERGELPEYLAGLGFFPEIDTTMLRYGNLWEIQDRSAAFLAHKIRNARRSGYLDELLRKLDMQEIIEPIALHKAAVTRKPRLRAIQGGKKS